MIDPAPTFTQLRADVEAAIAKAQAAFAAPPAAPDLSYHLDPSGTYLYVTYLGQQMEGYLTADTGKVTVGQSGNTLYFDCPSAETITWQTSVPATPAESVTRMA